MKVKKPWGQVMRNSKTTRGIKAASLKKRKSDPMHDFSSRKQKKPKNLI